MALTGQKTAFDELELGGSGGYVGLVRVDQGFKVFVSGRSLADSFIPCDPSDPQSVATALATAKELSNKPQKSVRVTIFKDSVLNKEVTWQGDRLLDSVQWSEGYKQVLYPSMDEFMSVLDFGKPFWAQVSFKPDPVKPTRTGSDGTEQPNLVPYLVNRFNSKEEALQALDSDGNESAAGNSNGLAQPPDFDPHEYSWQEALDFVASDTNPIKMRKRAGELGLSAAHTTLIVEHYNQVPF